MANMSSLLYRKIITRRTRDSLRLAERIYGSAPAWLVGAEAKRIDSLIASDEAFYRAVWYVHSGSRKAISLEGGISASMDNTISGAALAKLERGDTSDFQNLFLTPSIMGITGYIDPRTGTSPNQALHSFLVRNVFGDIALSSWPDKEQLDRKWKEVAMYVDRHLYKWYYDRPLGELVINNPESHVKLSSLSYPERIIGMLWVAMNPGMWGKKTLQPSLRQIDWILNWDREKGAQQIGPRMARSAAVRNVQNGIRAAKGRIENWRRLTSGPLFAENRRRQ